MKQEPRLEEQAISKAVEIGMSSQLDAADKIDVDIHTDLLKMILGCADSVEIAGKGVVIQKDIRVQEMEVHTDSININPFSAIFGQVELNEPVDANARIVITEPDLNRALNSDYVLRKARNLKLNVDGRVVTLDMQHMELKLPGSDKMVFTGKSLLHEAGKTQQLCFTAASRPRTKQQPVLLEAFQCHEGYSITIEVAVAMMEKIKELVKLPFFELEGMAIRIEEMEVQAGKITLQVQAHITQFPTS